MDTPKWITGLFRTLVNVACPIIILIILVNPDYKLSYSVYITAIAFVLLFYFFNWLQKKHKTMFISTSLDTNDRAPTGIQKHAAKLMIALRY